MNSARRLVRSNMDDLFHALVNGPISQLENYWKMGGSKGLCDSSGKSLLMGSILANRQDLLDFCLGAGVPVNQRDCNGCTALHWAVQINQLEMMEALIRAGADMNGGDGTMTTPLMVAILRQEEDAAQLLIRHGCSLTARSIDGNTALYLAAHYLPENLSHLTMSLVAEPQLLHVENVLHETPLKTIFERKQYKLAEALLKKFVEPNDPNLAAVLGALAAKHCVRGINMILEHGFSFFHTSKVGLVTAAILASPSLRACQIRLVQEYSAVTCPDKRNAFPLLHSNPPLGITNSKPVPFLVCTLKVLGVLEHTRSLLECGVSGCPCHKLVRELQDRPWRMPLSLKAWCRTAIRMQLSFAIIRKVKSLPLPPSLLCYLSLEDEVRRIQSALI